MSAHAPGRRLHPPNRTPSTSSLHYEWNGDSYSPPSGGSGKVLSGGDVVKPGRLAAAGPGDRPTGGLGVAVWFSPGNRSRNYIPDQVVSLLALVGDPLLCLWGI